jgi:hypothetical protein
MNKSQATQLANQSGLVSWETPWIPVGAAGFRVLSTTISWAAFALTNGAFSVVGTDDPAQAAASEVLLTISSTHGTFPTVGATAANAMVVLSNCPGYVKWKYTRAAGGTAGQFNLFTTATE